MIREDHCTVCGDCLTWCPYIEIGEPSVLPTWRKRALKPELAIMPISDLCRAALGEVEVS